MGNIAGTANWEENVYQFETTDVVEGGADGVDNLPLKQLANRTAFLKAIMERGKQGITLIGAGTATLTVSQCANKLLLINAAGASVILTLPTLTTDDAGFTTNLLCYGVTANQVIVNKSGTGLLLVPDSRDALFFGNGDSATLIWTGALWVVADFKGNFTDVGKAEFDYIQRPNTVVADGSLLNRSAYPRLWEFAQSLGGSIITDSTWTGVSGYKGFFSYGNGTTTFRIPDLRSMSIRALDLGAGISYGRNSGYAGGYEADELKSHNHVSGSYNKAGAKSSEVGGNGTPGSIDSTSPTTEYKVGEMTSLNWDAATIKAYGGSETRPKNIGLIPLIKV